MCIANEWRPCVGDGTGKTNYEFKKGFAMPVIFFFNLHRNVPYFYDTFWVKKITLVAELNAIPDAPWWSAALAHTIT